MRNICISAIHTDVGKSCVSAALCEAFGFGYFKLVQAGEKTDESFIKKLTPNTMVYGSGVSLKTAASPHLGMMKEKINYNGLDIKIPNTQNVLIELAGGLFSPLDMDHFMIDYLSHHHLATFLVTKNYLGSINHTALSIEALKARKIEILGVIISQRQNKSTQDFLQRKYQLNFFHLNDIHTDFKAASNNLKKQILKANVL